MFGLKTLQIPSNSSRRFVKLQLVSPDKTECASEVHKHLDQFGAKLPQGLRDELNALESRL